MSVKFKKTNTGESLLCFGVCLSALSIGQAVKSYKTNDDGLMDKALLNSILACVVTGIGQIIERLDQNDSTPND